MSNPALKYHNEKYGVLYNFKLMKDDKCPNKNILEMTWNIKLYNDNVKLNRLKKKW